MALKQLVNWLGQQRVDIPDLRAIESGVIFDFKSLIQCLVGNTPYILRGFTIPVTGVSGPATSLQLVVDSATVWIPGDGNGSFLRVESGTANEILSPANAKVVGSFSPGANFVSIRFNRATDPTTNDLVSVWDVDSQTEFTKTAPRGLVMNYEIVIDGSTFGNNAPVAIVNVSGSNVTSIKNCKQGLFRLGTGGANPNISYSKTLAVDPENPLLATTNSSPDPFAGGDWEFQTLKDWMDRVMTLFKEIYGSAFWYSGSSLIPDINLTNMFFDLAASKITGAGAWQHSSSTPGMLTWTSSLNMRSIFGTMTLVVPANNVTLSDLDVAYISLVRNQDFQPANTFTFTNGSTTVSATLNISGISAGDYIKYEAHNLTSWTKVSTVVGSTITLSDPYPGASVAGKALRTQGSYTMQVAAPNSVPVSGDTYWIAKRDDNAFATLTVASIGSSGLIRANDIATVKTTAAHGLVEGQSVAISGASDSTFDGHFDVLSIVSSTEFTILNPGADVGSGVAGGGSVSSVPKIYLRMSGGVGELEQGEQVQIDDETTLNILKFIGAENEADTTPPYTITPNGLSPYSFSSANNLTQAISAITGNVNDIFTTLDLPAYDEPLVVVSGAPADSNEVQAPVNSGDTLTLPLHSRRSDIVQNYVVGKGYLEVFLNGQLLTQNVAGTSPQVTAQNLTTFGSSTDASATTAEWMGQSFTPTISGNIDSALFRLRWNSVGTPVSGTAVAKLYADDGFGFPGSLLETSDAVDLSVLTGSYQNITFPFSSSAAMTASTLYHIVLDVTNITSFSGGSQILFDGDNSGSNPYAGGRHIATLNSGSTWLAPGSGLWDLYFVIEIQGLGGITYGWTEVGAPLSNSNQIIINQDLALGDILTFRIDGPGGPGSGSGAPDDDFHNLPATVAPDNADEIPIWDNSLSAYRKMTRGNFLSGVSNILQINTYASTHLADVNTDDVILMNASGGSVTVNLPAAASASGKVFYIKKVDASANAVVIDPNGAETIDGTATKSTTTQYVSYTVVSDGTQWHII